MEKMSGQSIKENIPVMQNKKNTHLFVDILGSPLRTLQTFLFIAFNEEITFFLHPINLMDSNERIT